MGTYRQGDSVIIPRVPHDAEEWPNFTSEMEKEIGHTLTIVDVYDDNTCSINSAVLRGVIWKVKFDWILPATESAMTIHTSPYSKICNKIKQMDAKWEAKQKQKGIVCA